MPSTKPNLFTRDDTMLGVCQGLGEDFGFNPNYLRLALPLPLFLYPAETIVGYLMVGLVVFLVHWLVPNRAVENSPVDVVQEEAETSVFEEEPLPLAA